MMTRGFPSGSLNSSIAPTRVRRSRGSLLVQVAQEELPKKIAAGTEHQLVGPDLPVLDGQRHVKVLGVVANVLEGGGDGGAEVGPGQRVPVLRFHAWHSQVEHLVLNVLVICNKCVPVRYCTVYSISKVFLL